MNPLSFSAAYPSEYLRPDDLNDQSVAAEIKSVAMKEVGREQEIKPVVHFTNFQKGLVLNKTNGRLIAKEYGDDMSAWEGAEVILFPTEVEFKGEMKATIRVKIPPRRRAEASPNAPPRVTATARPELAKVAAGAPVHPNGPSDEIPFAAGKL
jgi:hypothetical protein